MHLSRSALWRAISERPFRARRGPVVGCVSHETSRLPAWRRSRFKSGKTSPKLRRVRTVGTRSKDWPAGVWSLAPAFGSRPACCDSLHGGTTLGEDFVTRVAPVTARQVRLSLLETVEGPGSGCPDPSTTFLESHIPDLSGFRSLASKDLEHAAAARATFR